MENLYQNSGSVRIKPKDSIYQNDDFNTTISKDPIYGNIEEDGVVYLTPKHKIARAPERVEKRPKARKKQRNPRNPVISRYDEDNYALPNLPEESSRKSVGFSLPRFNSVSRDSIQENGGFSNIFRRACRIRHIIVGCLFLCMLSGIIVGGVVLFTKSDKGK